MRSFACALTATLAWISGAVTCVSGQTRFLRTFAQEHGLIPPVHALAQDSAGFLWLGAAGGLFRFDGSEMRRWAPDVIRDVVYGVAVSPAGQVVAVERNGRVYDVTADGARLVLERGATTNLQGVGFEFDGAGTLWMLRGDTVLTRSDRGEWRRLPVGLAGSERIRRVRGDRGAGAYLVTDSGVWRFSPDQRVRKIFTGLLTRDVTQGPDGRLLVLVQNAGDVELFEIDDGDQRRVYAPNGLVIARSVSFVERHGTIWVSLDRFLFAVAPGRAAEVLVQEDGIESGGPLLVDREGSLWLGSYAGLHQFPEPDTRIWTERHGIRSRHTTWVARSHSTVWLATWAGLNHVRERAEGWRAEWASLDSGSYLCTDARGSLWTYGNQRHVFEIRDSTYAARYAPITGPLSGCAVAPDGGVWLESLSEILHAGPAGVRSLPAPAQVVGGTRGTPALHDEEDRVWLGLPHQICHAPAARLFAGEADAWTCEDVPALHELTGLVPLPGGRLWAGSSRLGLLVRDSSGWRPVSGAELPTPRVAALVASRRGGAWIVGDGVVRRASERGTDSLEVHERLTSWHGLPAEGAGHLLEDDDGTIWLASERGLIRVPASVRFAPLPVPRVALVEARVDDVPVRTAGRLELPHNRNRIELRFAALSYRNPAQLRHQVRLGPDEPWSESRGGPSFRWADLRPGQHEVEYRASLDGIHWSAEPVRFAFVVRPPWYGTRWFLLFVVAGAVMLAWLVYRARVAYLLGLERQRTRIAMDLHDEVGSGLASVGILSGVLASDGLGDVERRRTATAIAAAAEELGHSLSDIVWSLDPRSGSLAELAARLAEHGDRLCAHGNADFTTQFPRSWPADGVDVAIQRNIFLIGLEALHNATRHADASCITLSLRRRLGGDWELAVRDDGVGIDTGAGAARSNGHGHGRGLASMRRRADEIGAVLLVQSTANAGTTITLRFRLRRGPGRARRFVRSVARW